MERRQTTGVATLIVNGRPHRSQARTLPELLREIGHDPDGPGIAVAVNDEVVRRSGWPSRVLREGDRVEVVAAVQGG